MIFLATTIVIALCALLLMVNRLSRLFALWGALWGMSMGVWAIAPLLLRVHYLHPQNISQWAVISAALLSIFACLGALLTFAGCVPFAIGRLFFRARVRRPDLLSAGMTAWLLPLVYLSLSAIIEWRNFSRAPAAITYATLMATVATLWVAAAWLCIAAYWPSRSADRRTDPALRWMVAAVTLLGVLVLPLRVPAPAAPPAGATQETHLTRSRQTAPLLVVALDGGNWPTMRPLLDKGSLPLFSRLVRDGIHGRLNAQWPPFWSAAAWGAIMTGHSADEIGVHEDLSATAPGLPTFELPLTLNPALDPLFAIEFVLAHIGIVRPEPPRSDALREQPVWKLLTDNGLETAVVRMRFTYPAGESATFMLSERIVTDLWDAFGTSDADKSALVWPPSAAPQVFRWLSEAEASADSAFKRLIPGASAHPVPNVSFNSAKVLSALLGFDDIANAVFGIVTDPVIVLKRVFGFDHRTLHVTEQLAKAQPDLDVVIVYIGGFDVACHALWEYRFPEAFTRPPSVEAVAEFGPVLDRYLQFIDDSISRIAAAFPVAPNILVVSDHGEQADQSAPLWKGVHSPQGIFLAAGPDVRRDPSMIDVSYFDIVPTVLDIKGLTPPPSINGRSLR